MPRNAPSPTAQLQSIRSIVSVIFYRMRIFRAADVSRFSKAQTFRNGFPRNADCGREGILTRSGNYRNHFAAREPLVKSGILDLWDFLVIECGEEVSSLGKSVCFRTRWDFSYNCGEWLSGKNVANNGKEIFEADGHFCTKE